MLDADARVMARHHTAHLLKMLRGPSAAAESAALSTAPLLSSVRAAETSPAYVVHRTQAAAQPLAAEIALPVLPAAPAPPRSRRKTLPTVGDSLRAPASGVLGALMTRARELKRLSGIFLAYLPPQLRAHALLVRLDAERWEVHTEAASWATRLRYALATIRQPLGQQLSIVLPKPRIRVKPAALPPVSHRPPLALPQGSAEQIERLARTLSDPALRAALQRLAAHSSPSTVAEC
ncbi:MAG: DciA family protein [Candidatus Contendobacter sp.]